VTFILDPEAGGEQLAQRIERELGVTVATHSQKPSPMALAAQGLAELIAGRRLEHPDHADFNAHVLAAAAKQGPGVGWRFVKRRRGGAPIDAVIALAMAARHAMAPPEPEPTFENVRVRELPSDRNLVEVGGMQVPFHRRYVDEPPRRRRERTTTR
jgi:hypothetical protein